MNKTPNPFFCYSKKLHKELDEAGFKYVAIGHHDKTGNIYWLYMPTVELNEFLQKHRERFN